jgi:hypothetical protein
VRAAEGVDVTGNSGLQQGLSTLTMLNTITVSHAE